MRKQYWAKRDSIKNYFPLPNEIFSLGLSSTAIAIYGYLLFREDRKTYECLASYRMIGEAIGKSVTTVRKYVAELEERGLIATECTSIITKDGRKSYLDAADARGVLPMFYLELVSGLRKGELVALLWSDLDGNHKTISVSKQYVRNPSGEVTLSRPKTETSVRQVSIPQVAVDLLIQEHNKHPDNPYMFPSPVTGEMYHPDSVVKLHEKILKDAGLEHIRFHDLRHTFATLALQNGVDVKTVSSMLGHYDAGFTLRTYTHATRQMQNQAAETMGNFMAKVL